MASIKRIKDIALSLNCEIKENEALSEYTTFKIGGPARLMVFPDTSETLASLLKGCTDEGIKPFILGNGSNLLVSDKGLSGVTICTEKLNFCRVNGEETECGAGLLLSKLCTAALDNSLTGLEFAYGIPGSVGGAVYMNAGAYGGEMKDVVVSCTVADENGNVSVLTNEELRFSYRNSLLQMENLAVLSAKLSLKKGDSESIRKEMSDTLEKRKRKQPLNFPSAGSAFKRPEGYFAGALIEQCSLKGVSVGGAQVSEKHAGFIVNKGGATAEDVLSLVKLIKETVLKETGVTLESEIKYISDQGFNR